MLRLKGEIHRYVGDEVIITWKKKPGLKDASAARCHFEMVSALERERSAYMREFGIVPEFWSGLHLGKVVSGEVGASKQEIVFVGDTMNTTARVEQSCREYDEPLVVSGSFIEAVELPDQLQAVNLGSAELRGVKQPVDLFTIRQVESRR